MTVSVKGIDDDNDEASVSSPQSTVSVKAFRQCTSMTVSVEALMMMMMKHPSVQPNDHLGQGIDDDDG